MTQTISIDLTVYAEQIHEVKEKIKNLVDNHKVYKHFVDVVEDEKAVYISGDYEEEIQFIVDDYGCLSGSGHYNATRGKDFIQEFINYALPFSLVDDYDNNSKYEEL